MIQFLDLGAATRELKVEIDFAVARVVDSGWYIGGPEVAAFETEWAAYCGAKHAVGVGNGLDALHLALKAVDVGPGDEVIVGSNGYIATQLAVTWPARRRCRWNPTPRLITLTRRGLRRQLRRRPRSSCRPIYTGSRRTCRRSGRLPHITGWY